MKLLRVLNLSLFLVVLITPRPANADSNYCTGTYGGGDYRVSYIPHGSPALTSVLTVPAVSGKVIRVSDDMVYLTITRKDGIAVGDKVRIERTSGSGIVAVGEVSLTRVGDDGSAGMLLGDHPVQVGDSAVTTRRGMRVVPSTFDLPPVVATTDRETRPPKTTITPTPDLPKVASLPVPVIQPSAPVRPESKKEPVSPKIAVLPEPTAAIGDYLNEIPSKQLDIWASGHSPLKVFIANAERVKGYRPQFHSFAKEAFAEWTRASRSAVQFTYVETAEAADIEVSWTYERNDLDGKNELGITHTLRSDEGIEKARVRLLTSATKRGAHVTDSAMWVTTLHEIGHALGLAHSSNAHDVMTPVVTLDQDGESSIAGLTPRDISSISHLYGDTAIHSEIMKRHQQAIASHTAGSSTLNGSAD